MPNFSAYIGALCPLNESIKVKLLESQSLTRQSLEPVANMFP